MTHTHAKSGRLMLTRRVGQRIVLRLPDGRGVTIDVSAIRGEGESPNVRLAFVAPGDVEIWRAEVGREEPLAPSGSVV